MLASTLFVVFGCLFASVQSDLVHSRDVHSTKENIYRRLQARIVPVISSSTTKVRAARAVQPVTKRHGKRQANISLRISAALNQFLQVLDSEAAKIRAFAQGSSPETTATEAQEPLQNILKAAQQALLDVKNCEYAPSPSGSYQTPPSSPCPLLVAIIQCLKNLLITIQSVMSAAQAHQNLGDIFTQITGVVAQIISEVATKLPGAIQDLAQMGKDVLDSIRYDGYGFGDIMNVVRPL
ncbi:hypothetical protein MJO29_006827 [Puccinia striiformis f. sp. tritici]|uniref:Secreted protein n=1 Tax=Puccinia striiformis f. sp. tritici PST-78 TaxID=1165861 RepID=A0A0L0UZ94_9BASI|nr:hypothetical protein Pst134EA_012988 [Puccinia striiformis f. sp. tritici]KAI9622047.1 hypothetical protein H4Q26_015485 [Puccinia striiformis f. sp. tritici PST-130]KNE92372.1 hypothetical protein PSTG_14207 [Puccinia striiformis f. sp. tritici PST-78]KAH9453862.1 hypothetical protein Pst134EB_013964 [Puccinia striiformis f. sp. tritici]KAH9453876.1 hypothetical protein Pst134EB_013978 [Puccinia striiformis f. sp. tritici]KAH9465091.1 hypothetical protein Pst134EA_012988 [Puccinia striifor